MGQLRPDAVYIYENNDGIIYAREFGSNPNTRVLVGYDSSQYSQTKHLMNLMPRILDACQHDQAMKDLLEKLLIMYNLKYGDGRS